MAAAAVERGDDVIGSAHGQRRPGHRCDVPVLVPLGLRLERIFSAKEPALYARAVRPLGGDEVAKRRGAGPLHPELHRERRRPSEEDVSALHVAATVEGIGRVGVAHQQTRCPVFPLILPSRPLLLASMALRLASPSRQ